MIGECRLRTRLFERGYSMSELAVIAGVSLCQIYRIRQGKREINGKFIANVLRNFPGYKFEDLFYVERRERQGRGWLHSINRD